ncbi:hypothetical protein EJB05_36340 [Eragrostis curvula]|uniref:DUF6598 domain-containing protein n=1 Tax=Eragrostis curvula TaxID=38414 RepID=A0A5J9U936_9POAL|nr:hypothetical protein EJB05_36340 [Eragrostis curvula]
MAHAICQDGKIMEVGDEPDCSKAWSRGNITSGISFSTSMLNRKSKPKQMKRTRRRQSSTSVPEQAGKRGLEKMARKKIADLSKRVTPVDLYVLLEGTGKTYVQSSTRAKKARNRSIQDHFGSLEIEDALPLDQDEDWGLDMLLDLDMDCGLDPEEDCGLDLQLGPYMECGFDSGLEPDWNDDNFSSEVKQEERVVKALHLVRLYMITECDPVHHIPVRTRFCKFNLALFDFEKESTASRGPSILTLTSHDQIKLADSINVVSFKILKSDVGYPMSVYGTVLVRDQVDYKCIYLFKREKDNPQVITLPKDTLTLADPCRGLAVTDGMYFEIDLKVKRDDSGDTDFSKGVIERDIFVSGRRKLMTRLLTSWHSTVQLAYTPVPFAVAASLAINILEGPLNFFNGEVIAWTSGNKNRIILYDSKMAGTKTEIGGDGSVALSRCLVAVPVKEELLLRICVREGDHDVACFELTLDHLDDDRICCQSSCELQVKIEWTAILNRSEVGVLRNLGHTLLLV